MNNKLLPDKNASVDDLIKKINDTVGEKFQILDKEDNVKKWTGIPNLLLLDEVAQKRLLAFVEYMDSLLIPIEDKVMIIVSLSGLMEFANIKLYDYDDGSLYTMADFYKNSTIDEIRKSISLISNRDLLLAVREKVLDIKDRKNILSNIEKKYINDKIEVTAFIEKVIKELKEINFE